MKREDLKKIDGMTDEMINSVMNLHQADVTEWNTKIENQKSEIKTRDTQINDLNEKVKKFDGVDVEKLKNDIKETETKYKNQLSELKLNSAIQLALKDAKPRNEKALMALIDRNIIKLNDDGTVTGLKEQLENIKKENDFLFEQETKVKEVQPAGGHDPKPSTKEETYEDVIAAALDEQN